MIIYIIGAVALVVIGYILYKYAPQKEQINKDKKYDFGV